MVPCKICGILVSFLSCCIALVLSARCERSVDSNIELSDHVTEILNNMTMKYDRRLRPTYGGDAVDVAVTMYILGIYSVTEVDMDFTIDFYFRQMWKDKRLSFEPPDGLDTLSVGSEFIKTIWVPDTFFPNEVTSYVHTATTSNEFLRISKDGDILRSMRMTVTASCPMDLKYFPMDSQLCALEIESYGYTTADIQYTWGNGNNSVGLSPDVSLPQFKVIGHRQKTYHIALSTGNYSRLACEVQFQRNMGHYMMQYYLPSIVMVFMSWIAHWLHREHSPARTAIGVTTVLTMTIIMTNTNKAVAKISYVKSIDLYLGGCLVMVFCALLEYGVMVYFTKRILVRKAKRTEEEKRVEAERALSEEDDPMLEKNGNEKECNTSSPVRNRTSSTFSKPEDLNTIYGVRPSHIDRTARVGFPAVFLFFNILYWSYYLTVTHIDISSFILLGQG